MFRKDLLRSVLLYLKTGGYSKKINWRTCACYRTITSKVLSSSKSFHAASRVISFRQPTKKWKMIVKSGLDDEGEFTNQNVTACEQGTEAVPHSTLMSYLQNCSSVEEQINKMCSAVSLTEEDIENRKRFAESLRDLLIHFFPNLEISLFGSSINGFGFKGCDCDIAMDVNGSFSSESEMDMKRSGVRVELPTVADVESGKVPLENLPYLPPRLLLRFVRRVLRACDSSIDTNILLIKARHPILRFYSKKYNLFCDFSLGKNSSLQNTKSIRLIGHLDDRIMPLIKILRYWGKNCGFIGDIDHFNSYAFSLVVVFFLQNTSPPVLPPFSDLIEKSGYLVSGRVADDELMFNDLKKFPPSENTQTIEELVREFFFYYMYFDFSQVLCPLNSSCASKKELIALGGTKPFEFSAISLQDPFLPTFNLAHAATDKACWVFFKNCLRVCESYQKKDFWVPNPVTKWGLLSLLDLPAEGQSAPVETEHQHMIEIPLKTPTNREPSESGLGNAEELRFQRASKAVVDIFERGLLFKCRTLDRNSGVSFSQLDSAKETDWSQKPILQLQCTAYHNVFSGRSNWQRLSVPDVEVEGTLEKEHLISLDVSQKKKNETGQALFGFDCELFQFYKEDVPTLLVSLNFRKVAQPAVIVFLKEYLPRFVQQSL